MRWRVEFDGGEGPRGGWVLIVLVGLVGAVLVALAQWPR